MNVDNWNCWDHLWSPVPATYYFDPINGNDAQAGTAPNTAWQTQAKAENTALAGGQSIMKKIDGNWIVFKRAAIAASAGWCYGYYQTGTVYTQPVSSIDYAAYTHIAHDHVVPLADGTLNDTAYSFASYTSSLIAAAHAAGCKVILVVAYIAGSDSGLSGSPSFLNATATPTIQANLVNSIVSYVLTHGYDGVDIDWEEGGDPFHIAGFMANLYAALKAQNPNYLVCMAVGSAAIASLPSLPYTDKMTLMCYGLYLTGGKITWINCPLEDGNLFTFWGNPLLSAESITNGYLRLGFPASKLMLGLGSYGQQYWDPALGCDTGGPLRPRQRYTKNYCAGVAYLSYPQVMALYGPTLEHWDELSKTPYLSIANADPTLNQYVTYDDPAAFTAKIAWAGKKGLGGLAVWEVSMDYISARAITNPLTNTLHVGYNRAALAGAAPSTPAGLQAAAISAASATIHWPVVPNAISYHVKRSTASGSGYATIATVPAPGYTDATLTAGGTYYYVVSALNWGVEGANSAELAVTAAVLPAPTNLLTNPANLTAGGWSVNAASGAAITSATRFHANSTGVTSLSQTVAVTAATAYVAVIRCTLAANWTWATLNVYGSDYSTLASIGQGLAAGVPFTYTLAFNSGAYTSVFFSVDVPDAAGVVLDIDVSTASIVASAGNYLPLAPTSFAATAPVAVNVLNSFSTALSWLWSAGATGYNLYRSVGDAGQNMQYLASTAGLTYSDASLTPGAVFNYVVRAAHGVNESLPSSMVSVTTPLAYAAPNALTSPNDISAAAWTCSGTGVSALNAYTLQCGTGASGDSFLTQNNIPTVPGANYIATVTVSSPVACYGVLSVSDHTYTPGLGSLGQNLAAGAPAIYTLPFNCGASTGIVFTLDFDAGANNAAVTVTNASVHMVLPGVPVNMLVSPLNIQSPAWGSPANATGPLTLNYPSGSSITTGISQQQIPVTPNTDYLATVNCQRDGTFADGSGGYPFLGIEGGAWVEGLGGLAGPFYNGIPTLLFVPFNSGSYSQIVFAVTIPVEAAGSNITFSNLTLTLNPYANVA